MTKSDPVQTQRDYNKFAVWLQSSQAAQACKNHTSLIQHFFSSDLTGPQLGLVNCDQRFEEAIGRIPGLIQPISCDNFISQRNIDFPAASLNTIIVPFGLSFMGEDCDEINWQQLTHLLAPGGKILVTGINPDAPANILSSSKPPATATSHYRAISKTLELQGLEVGKRIFHGVSSRTTVPSIYCSSYPLFSPLLVHWAILFTQSKPCGTFIGRLKPTPRKQTSPLGSNRQT